MPLNNAQIFGFNEKKDNNIFGGSTNQAPANAPFSISLTNTMGSTQPVQNPFSASNTGTSASPFQTNIFGKTPATNQNNIFGQTNSSSPFGTAPAANTNPFGAQNTSAGSPFGLGGTTNNAATNNIFGKPQSPAIGTNTTATNIFAPNTGITGFPNTTNTTTSSPFGGFGAS